MQRAAHVQLHILAVRGQGLQTVRGGARLHTRGARGLQAFGCSGRRARGLGRHASERTRVAVEGSLCARDRFPETPRLQRGRPTARRTRPLATATPRRPPASPSLSLHPEASVQSCAGAAGSGWGWGRCEGGLGGRAKNWGVRSRWRRCSPSCGMGLWCSGRAGNLDEESVQVPFAPCSCGRSGPQPVTVAAALHSRERKQAQRLKVEHRFPRPVQRT